MAWSPAVRVLYGPDSSTTLWIPTSTMLRSPTRWHRQAAVYHVVTDCDSIRILGHQLLSLRFILIGFIIALRFRTLLMLNIQRNRQLFHNVSMQIKSLTNGVLARDQLAGIQHGLSRSQQQHSNKKQVSGVAKAPQDDQHDVYTTGAGSVVGSGSAAPPKRLPIRSPDNSPNKPKPKKPRESCSAAELDDFYGGWSDAEWEFAQLIE